MSAMPPNGSDLAAGGWPECRLKPGSTYAMALHPALDALALGRACRMLRKPTEERPHRLSVHPSAEIQASKAARRVVRDLSIPLALTLTDDHAPGEWALSDGSSTVWSAGTPVRC